MTIWSCIWRLWVALAIVGGLSIALRADSVPVFIFAGQSNAQGYGNRIQLAPVPTWAQTSGNGWTGAPVVSSDSAIQYPHPTLANSPMLYTSNPTGLLSSVLNAWCFYEGSNSSSGCGDESSFGPELSFLRIWQDAHPGSPVAVIKVVLGGSSIGDWLPSGSMDPVWRLMVQQGKDRITAAGLTYYFAGLLWMQGESGASNVYAFQHPNVGAEYSDQLRTFLSGVRAATDTAMPVVIGRIGNHMLADVIILPQVTPYVDQYHTGTTAQMLRDATEYRRSQQVLVGNDPGNSLVDTDNLPVLQSGSSAYWYHHTSAGYLAMGERFYAKWSGTSPPPPPQPCQVTVKFSGVTDPSKTASVLLNGATICGTGDMMVVDVH